MNIDFVVCVTMQIVWKKTAYIGADWRYRKDGRLVVVIKYDPIGNWASKKAFSKNVFPPLYPTTAMTTTVVASTANATNGSSANEYSTIATTKIRQPRILAGTARAMSTALVLAGTLMVVLLVVEL